MKRWFVAVFSCGWLSLAAAAEVHVAVAANFNATFDKIAAAYRTETAVKVLTSYASSGKLYTQVVNGAPFDMLLSADTEMPLKLEREGHSVVGARATYAIGHLVLWSPQPALVDAKGVVLQGAGFTRLAIANPKIAPYGLAAQQALTSLGLWDSVRSRLVLGENIAQTYQYASSGNAQLAFVARSQVLDVDGSMWQVPQHLYEPIAQDMVILKRGQANPAARKLYDYLLGKKARKIISDGGYSLPQASR